MLGCCKWVDATYFRDKPLVRAVNQDAHSRSGETFFFFSSSRPGTTA